MEKFNRAIENLIVKIKEIHIGLEPPVRKRVWLSFILGIFQFFVETFFIIVIQGFFYSTGVIVLENAVLPTWYPTSINANYFLILVYGLLKSLVYFFKNYLNNSAYQKFVSLKRLRIFSRVLNPQFNEPHHIVYSVFNDQVTRGASIVTASVSIMMAAATSVFLFLYCFKIARLETILGVLFILAFQFIISFFGSWVGKIGEELNEHWENINYTMKNAIRNSFFINIKSKNKEVYKSSESLLLQYEGSIRSFYFWSSLKGAIPHLVGIIILVIITHLSLKYFHTQKFVLVTFLYLFLRFVQVVNECYVWLMEIKFCFPSFRSLQDFIQIQDTKDYVKSDITKIERIELRNINFNYEGGISIFNDLNLSLKKGDILVITGESGTGKSTLIKLLTGLINPNSGEIYFNDEQYLSNMKSIGKTISYSGPEPFIINASLKDNLLYASQNSILHEQLAKDLLEKFGMWETFVSREGFQTLVKDFHNFSTGQMQRISLIRALLQDTDLLILDEATSNLDNLTEKKVIDEILRKSSKRITIITSHRLAFLEIATHKLNLVNAEVKNE